MVLGRARPSLVQRVAIRSVALLEVDDGLGAFEVDGRGVVRLKATTLSMRSRPQDRREGARITRLGWYGDRACRFGLRRSRGVMC